MPTFYALSVFSNGITPRSFRYWASLFIIGMIVAVVLFHHLKSKTTCRNLPLASIWRLLGLAYQYQAVIERGLAKDIPDGRSKECKTIAIWQSSKLQWRFHMQVLSGAAIYRLYEKNPPVAPASRYHLKKWSSIGDDHLSNCRLVSVGSKSILD